ncbi:carbohydrate ABC transporter permease [Clostridium estertheticum]|uniref:Carbohydrate ABC transporter permease n=1 Tax=Clostridium estertheticum TaxID=238834 RepID=A0A7Y3WT23_9CLOT|nr:carbohydrate ABC transporter permease [Clostridium estertheticum]MBW9173946.1 carbohydrate ABC transporter permease [Clostridium estertheticum]NNU77712.1 carbohydrate ABC transporter permease [Clostridium estertheticum]WBL47996.1 carbohydrate ABC transporter permease [Clostridium estertheticum]WLC76080.1 carbohydrate ABC transporter permease [Clostridium estertheticum]
MYKGITKTDRVILILNNILLGMLVLCVLVPLIYVVIASFTKPNSLLNSGLTLNPADWTLQGYKKVVADPEMLIGFKNSIFYAVAFSFISVVLTLFAAYPLSIENFVGKKTLMAIFVITMFFSGGLIPTYLVVKNLNMLDSVWAILLPGSINVWNLILARTYFQGIPKELREAAIVDGANDTEYFFKILIPLCKPIIAVLVLYQFVGQWNSYFDAMIYLKSTNLEPLQIVLRSILVQNQATANMGTSASSTAQLQQVAQMIKYASIVVSSLPLMIMYPFFQKYFDKGMLVGSIKG